MYTSHMLVSLMLTNIHVERGLYYCVFHAINSAVQ